jgi:RimJ/RimL family protein N-acetyltransferase
MTCMNTIVESPAVSTAGLFLLTAPDSEPPNRATAPNERSNTMTVVYYEGERIYFRPIEMDDEPQLRQWINDPHVWGTLGDRLPVNANREREWIENYGKNRQHVLFGIVVREDDRLIGTCSLDGIRPVAHSASYGLCIGDTTMHGKGYGTEATRLCLKFAFEELNLNRVELHVFSHNSAAQRVYEKAGFVSEGCRREAFYRQGEYRDVYVYAILRREYDAIIAKCEASKAAEPAIAV